MKSILIKSKAFLKGFLLFCFFFLPLIGVTIFTTPINVMATSMDHDNEIVVEHLRVHVPKEKREVWLEAERGSWGRWLREQDGFIGRELFWDPINESGTLLIRWSSREKWKAIPEDEINSIQARFEEIASSIAGQKSMNPFPLEFEGELLPQ